MLEKIFRPKNHFVTQDGVYEEYNQWEDDLEKNWLVRFLRKNFPDNKKRVIFFGPLGTPFLLHKKWGGTKVFFTMEDVDHPRTKLHLFYGDYGLPWVDLGLGFGEREESNYLRFPYWLTTTFVPDSTPDDIVKRIKEINSVAYEKTQECVLINKHDKKGTREMILRDVQRVMDVKLAGRWKNNTRDLWDKYNNDKYEYLKTFRFNICAENDNTPNYVTEKLFDAFICGCVPLYYGADNNPEPGIINREAVVFWNRDGDNSANLELVERLNTNSKDFVDFMHQPKILSYGEEWIIGRFEGLKEHFRRVLE